MVPEALILIVVGFFSVNAAGQRGGSGSAGSVAVLDPVKLFVRIHLETC